MFENKNLCSECGGKCCKTMPGIVSPEDINVSVSVLKELFKNGYCIDWWEGDPRPGHDELGIAYFIRPQTKNAEGNLLDASWGGECVFLTINGCSLSENDRPYECRMLEPRDQGCKKHGDTKKDLAVKWLPFKRIINEVIDTTPNL